MTCSTQGCTQPVHYTHMGKCKTCYAYFRYWQAKNSPQAIEARRARIRIWENRLTEMLRVRRVVRKRKAA